LYYAEPTNIEVTYYKNYEQVVKTVSVDKKCFLLGDKYKADYQEAPEGYFYYDTSNLPTKNISYLQKLFLLPARNSYNMLLQYSLALHNTKICM
jgi:hypothetical protein